MRLPPGFSVTANTALLVIDIIAIPLCMVGAAIALALVKPWGRKVGDRSLLVLASATSALCLLHALPSVVQAWSIAVDAGAHELSAQERFSLFLYEPYWLTGGILFGLAAFNFHRANRARAIAR